MNSNKVSLAENIIGVDGNKDNRVDRDNKLFSEMKLPDLNDKKVLEAINKPFKINGVIYKLEFNVCTMRELEKRYDSTQEWIMLVSQFKADAILYGAVLMFNEYAKRYNDSNPNKTPKPLFKLEDDADKIARQPFYKLVCGMLLTANKYMYAYE